MDVHINKCDEYPLHVAPTQMKRPASECRSSQVASSFKELLDELKAFADVVKKMVDGLATTDPPLTSPLYTCDNLADPHDVEASPGDGRDCSAKKSCRERYGGAGEEAVAPDETRAPTCGTTPRLVRSKKAHNADRNQDDESPGGRSTSSASTPAMLKPSALHKDETLTMT